MAKYTTEEYKEKLLSLLRSWIDSGIAPQEAVEKLTIKQYDFLIDHDVDLDNLLLTPEQKQAVNSIKRAPRSCSPNGYNKKYPQSKQELYNGIAEYIANRGAEIIPRDKQNYRDLDFTIDGTRYKIVLSNPR